MSYPMPPYGPQYSFADYAGLAEPYVSHLLRYANLEAIDYEYKYSMPDRNLVSDINKIE